MVEFVGVMTCGGSWILINPKQVTSLHSGDGNTVTVHLSDGTAHQFPGRPSAVIAQLNRVSGKTDDSEELASENMRLRRELTMLRASHQSDMDTMFKRLDAANAELTQLRNKDKQ